jgi:hypothetical protein
VTCRSGYRRDGRLQEERRRPFAAHVSNTAIKDVTHQGLDNGVRLHRAVVYEGAHHVKSGEFVQVLLSTCIFCY